jgi:hypothetical protein
MQANYRKTYKLTKTLIRLAYTIYLHKPCKYGISFSFVRKETRRPPARWQLGWLIRDPNTLLVDQVFSAHVESSTRLQQLRTTWMSALYRQRSETLYPRQTIQTAKKQEERAIYMTEQAGRGSDLINGRLRLPVQLLEWISDYSPQVSKHLDCSNRLLSCITKYSALKLKLTLGGS